MRLRSNRAINRTCKWKRELAMTRTFWNHNQRRLSMFVWTLVFLLIAAVQLLSRQHPLMTLLFFLTACAGCRIAWRRVAVPLYTMTDEDIRMSGVLIGDKRMRWHDIKDIQQEENWVRLIGREWIGSAHINLNHLPATERQEFVQLMRQHVHSANL
jgi:hypothetical protein